MTGHKLQDLGNILAHLAKLATAFRTLGVVRSNGLRFARQMARQRFALRPAPRRGCFGGLGRLRRGALRGGGFFGGPVHFQIFQP